MEGGPDKRDGAGGGGRTQPPPQVHAESGICTLGVEVVHLKQPSVPGFTASPGCLELAGAHRSRRLRTPLGGGWRVEGGGKVQGEEAMLGLGGSSEDPGSVPGLAQRVKDPVLP